ncbi:MAG: hypothetical protein NC324_09390 [Bacteroides sp.]|nr:hypothetical protein [Bacteroides sp.]
MNILNCIGVDETSKIKNRWTFDHGETATEPPVKGTIFTDREIHFPSEGYVRLFKNSTYPGQTSCAAGHAEAKVVVAVVGIVVVPVRHAAIDGVIVPAAAPFHAVGALPAQARFFLAVAAACSSLRSEHCRATEVYQTLF